MGALWFPSVRDVLLIHEDVLSEYPDTDAGVRDEGAVEVALESVERADLGDDSRRIHRAGAELLRLLVVNHPFVDGNKRTALNTVVVFYYLNGYCCDLDADVVDLLADLATDDASVEGRRIVEYLEAHTRELEEGAALDRWRDELVQFGIERFRDERSSDQND